MDITMFIGLAITALFGLVARFLISLIKAKVGAENLARIACFVETFVKAAEQMPDIKNKVGSEKLAWVLGQLRVQLEKLNLTIDEDALRALIEAQVREIKLEVQYG